MSLSTADEETEEEIHLPADINWEMLDKSKFFVLGAALFSAVSTALYPVVVVKTRQQVMGGAQLQRSSVGTAFHIVRHEGFRALYRGVGTSLMGTIPARALYMTALEVTKSSVGSATLGLGIPEATAATLANAAAGVTAAVAAQVVWTPVDVVSQRLMVQCTNPATGTSSCVSANHINKMRYVNGIDAFKKIFKADGIRGLYRGFGLSILTYAPSNAVWWASYSVAQRLIWDGIGCYICKRDDPHDPGDAKGLVGGAYRPDTRAIMSVQGVSAAMAGGVSALITMPLDTIKTRLQVLDSEENGRGRGPTVAQTVRNLVREGGWTACYRGLGPRWASLSLSATTMITTYEFLKRLSAKNQEGV